MRARVDHLRRDLAVQHDRRGSPAPRTTSSLLVHRASMTGMVVMDYAARYAEALTEMAGWMAAGKLLSKRTSCAASRRSR